MGVYGKRRRRRVWLRGVLVHFNYNNLNPAGIHLVHATKTGMAVLKWEVSWRNVNGILIRTRNSQTFLHFRRLPYYLEDRKR